MIPACSFLFNLVGSRCLTYRMYLPVSSVLADIRNQVCKKLRSCGLTKDEADIVSDRYRNTIHKPLAEYWESLPSFLLLDNIKSAMRPIYRANMVFVRIDRNPGRAILMCKALWVDLQQHIFVSCPRYSSSHKPLSSDTPGFAKDTIDDFQKYVLDATGVFVPLQAPAGACRPVGYWTVNRRQCLQLFHQY